MPSTQLVLLGPEGPPLPQSSTEHTVLQFKRSPEEVEAKVKRLQGSRARAWGSSSPQAASFPARPVGEHQTSQGGGDRIRSMSPAFLDLVEIESDHHAQDETRGKLI